MGVQLIIRGASVLLSPPLCVCVCVRVYVCVRERERENERERVCVWACTPIAPVLLSPFPCVRESECVSVCVCVCVCVRERVWACSPYRAGTSV